MKKLKYIILLIVLMSGGILSAQVIRNQGKINVSAGGQMVIIGNYQNELTGGITLDGIITVTGNWTNNGSTTLIESTGTTGEVIFNGSGTQTIGGTTVQPFYFEKLTINSGSTTQVQAGKGITAYGACTFSAPLVLKSSGTADFRPILATFINQSTVSGNITMELPYRSTGVSTPVTGRTLYFSSPISDASSTIFDVASGTNLLWYQDEVARAYVKVAANDLPLTVEKGYMLRSAASNIFSFTGTPNTDAAYTKNGIPRNDDKHFYLLGNPYPAVVDWNTISTTNLGPTIWYRSCNADGTMATADTYNKASGTGTSFNGTLVDGKIPPMQAVWIQGSTNFVNGLITISNTDRGHNWGSAAFLKKSENTDKDVFRLYVYSGDKRDGIVFIQSENAQNELDAWDSQKLFINSASIAEMYTLSPEKNRLVIQSVKPFIQNDTVLLGLNVGTAGEYKFFADFVETIGNYNIYLEDKLLAIKQDLFQNPEYIFNSEVVKDSLGLRFSLLFLVAPKLITATDVQVCAPKTADLTDISITSGSDAGLTYTYWLDAKATIAHTTPENSGNGVYYIKGEAANGTYKISDSIVVTINENPAIVVNPVAPVCEPGTIDLTDSLIIEGSTAGLTYTYWLDADATNSLSNPETVSSGTYYIKGIAETGCFSISERVEVIVNPKPEIVINNPDPVDSLSTVDLTAFEITVGSSTGLSYSYWLDAIATIPYLTPQYAVAGDYYLLGTHVTTGCFNIAGPIVVSYLSPTGIVDEIIKEIAIYSVNSIIYVNNAEPGTQILVYNIVGNLLYNKFSTSDREIINTNYQPGIYVVKVVGNQHVKSQKIYIQ